MAGKQAAPGQEAMALWGSVAGVGDRQAAMTNAWQQGSSACSASEPRLACGTPNTTAQFQGAALLGENGKETSGVTHVGETQNSQEK